MVFLKKAVQSDVPLLAKMNRGLIEDEQADNPITDAELEARMSGFLDGPYDAFIIEFENHAAGRKFWKSLGFKQKSIQMRYTD